MLKIIQARLQQYVKCEIPDVQSGFREGRGTRDQIANIHWIIEKAREFQKNIYFCYIDYAKDFVKITISCGNFWKGWEYQTTWSAFWETCIQVRKQELELDMEQSTGSKLGEGYIKAVYCHLFNLYAEYIMQNARQDVAQAGIKIAGRNIKNFRYEGDNTLVAESEEQLKSLCWKWKRRVKKPA